MFDSPPLWMWIVGFLLLLGPLVTIHELGHYLVGRWFGVKAEAFSIGFGKEIWGRTDRRGTRWRLSMIPLGGYVQFKGDMNPASAPDRAALEKLDPGERESSFHCKPLWQRALIVFAGPATNLLLAIAILAGFNLAYGSLEASATVGDFAAASAAREAGVQKGDRIFAVDGKQIEDFSDLSREVLMHPNRTIVLSVERKGQKLTIPVTIQESVERDRFGNESRVGRLGIYAAAPRIRKVGPIEAVVLATRQSVDLMRMMVTGIVQIVSGDRSMKELGGPIKIAKFSGEQLSLGPQAFVSFAALISINLAFINLLPIPALDGGHLAFYALEAVRRKPVGAVGQEWAYRLGIALVLVLMLIVTVNDVISLPIFSN